MSSVARIMLPLLSPAALLFEGVVRLRNGMYSRGLLEGNKLPAPVISIGNITTGGSGKTPLAMEVATLIAGFGVQPVLLSRGYGRASPETTRIVSPESDIPSPATVLGDEPALFRRRLPAGWLGISSDRYEAACAILKKKGDAVFILDDGFQHRKLRRDLDIVVVDTSQPLEENHLLPRGTLREPIEALRRAHLIMFNEGSPAVRDFSVDNLAASLQFRGRIMRCRQEVAFLTPFAEWKCSASSTNRPVSIRSCFLVAAIGNPERFRRNIEALGIEIAGTRFYRDHTLLRVGDWLSCAEEARVCGAEALITTEKDAVKISDSLGAPLLVAVQCTRIFEAKEFSDILKQTIGACR